MRFTNHPAVMLSRRCEYGMAAVLYLAATRAKGYVPIRRISDELGLSFPFLTKVLQDLNDAGYLTSMRGPNGGIAFARPPESLNLKDIVVAIDGPQLFTECVLGLPECGNAKPCPMHEEWGPVRDQLEKLFECLSVAEAARREALHARFGGKRIACTDS